MQTYSRWSIEANSPGEFEVIDGPELEAVYARGRDRHRRRYSGAVIFPRRHTDKALSIRLLDSTAPKFKNSEVTGRAEHVILSFAGCAEAFPDLAVGIRSSELVLI
jgi:hypothetical protein